MDLTKILSVSGKPGLHKMVAQSKTGLVVESLLDGRRFTAFSHQRVSSLEEISIFTYGEDLPLKEVFKAMYDKLEGQAAPDPRDSSVDLGAFFQDIVEEYDQERVYDSDIRKVLSWYNLLLEHGLLEFNEAKEGETAAEEAVEAEETPTGAETGEGPEDITPSDKG